MERKKPRRERSRSGLGLERETWETFSSRQPGGAKPNSAKEMMGRLSERISEKRISAVERGRRRERKKMKETIAMIVEERDLWFWEA